MRTCALCGVNRATGERGPARCPDCVVVARRESTADRNRRWRAEKRRTFPMRSVLTVAAQGLPTACWCEAEVAPLTPEEVRAGTGVSCGRHGCHAPAA